MTKSPCSGGDGFVRCSAHVNYKGRSGQCERRAVYPDVDGIRWWCGLHNPNRPKAQEKKAKLAAEEHVEAPLSEVGIEAPPIEPVVIRPEIVEAMRKAHSALTEVANARDTGWPEATPAENYKVLLKYLNDRAAEGQRALSMVIRKIESPPANAG